MVYGENAFCAAGGFSCCKILSGSKLAASLIGDTVFTSVNTSMAEPQSLPLLFPKAACSRLDTVMISPVNLHYSIHTVEGKGLIDRKGFNEFHKKYTKLSAQ